MNKPQYLAELGRLLIFMTSADRERTLDRIGALIDKAGPAGADALLARLGTPVSEAIRLSRIYNASGDYEDELLDSLEREAGQEPEHTAAPAPEAASVVPETKTAAAPVPTEEHPAYDISPLIMDDLPGYEPPVIPSNFQADEPETEPAPEPEPVPEAETPAEPEEPPAEPAVPDWISAPEEPASPEETAEAAVEAPAAASASVGPAAPEAEPETEGPEGSRAGPAYTVERSMPLWVGVPLFILSLAVIALPLGAVCIVLIPVLALPGVALLLGAWLAAVGGLWSISYIADAAVLFGLALVILAAALVVLWLGLWLLVAILSLYFRGLRGLADLTLGKKVEVHA